LVTRGHFAMSNTLDDQLSAFGVAQVIVVLKPEPPTTVAARPAPALAAAIPVAASRPAASPAAQSVVMQLGSYFRVAETSADTALGEAAARKSPGVRWYDRARNASAPTPPARYYPNLGVMLGTVDRTGLSALRTHGRVAKVVAPPVLSLIHPVAA